MEEHGSNSFDKTKDKIKKKVTVIISGNLFLLMLQIERMPKDSKSELFLISDLWVITTHVFFC